MNKLIALSQAIDRLNDKLGRLSAWLVLFMALVTFVIVLLRYAFNLGWIWLQDSVTYAHGSLFLLAAAYAYLGGEHVRVDIFYQGMTPQKKAKVDLFGVLFLLFPMTGLILANSIPSVIKSWSILEGSREAGGMPGFFLVKTMVPLFAILLILQGISQATKSLQALRGETKSGEKNEEADHD